MANLMAYHGHLVRRIVSDLEFLKESEQLSTDDYAAILARLPRSERVLSPQLPGASLIAEMSGNFNAIALANSVRMAGRIPPPLPGRHGSVVEYAREDHAMAGVDTRIRVRATFAYPMGQPDDLPFVKGDIIILEEEINADWWRGSCEGRSGIFPSNHVERIPSTSTPVPQRRPHSTPSPAPTSASIYNTSDSGSYIHPNNVQNGPWDRAYGQQMNQSQTSFSTQQNGLQSTYAQPPTPVHLPSIWNEPAKLPERSYTSNTNNTNDFPPSPGPGAMQPFQAPPPAQYAVAQQQQQQQLGPPPIAPKKNFGGLGGTLGHALVGGVGFGAGSAVAGEAIRGMF